MRPDLRVKRTCSGPGKEGTVWTPGRERPFLYAKAWEPGRPRPARPSAPGGRLSSQGWKVLQVK